MHRMRFVALLAVLVVCVTGTAWAEGHRSVGRAELYSWIIPGTGQLYVGDEGRAAGFFLGWFVAAAIDDSGVLPLSVNVWSGFDAGKCADEHNDRLPNRGLALVPMVDPNGKGLGLAMNMRF